MGFLVGFIFGGILGWIHPGAHEAVSCAFVGNRIILLARGFHSCLRVWNRGADSTIGSGVEAVNRSIDAGHVLGRRTVENKRRAQIMTIRSEAKRLSSAPAESGNHQLAIR